MTQSSLYVTTSDSTNLANYDFLFKADLLPWQVAGNFRQDRWARADHITSHWDKDRSQNYPRMPRVPEGLPETQEKQQCN